MINLELQRSIPRSVSLTAGGKWAVFGIAALLAGGVVGGALLLDRSVRDQTRLEQYRNDSVAGTATISRIHPAPRGEDKRQKVEYRFTAGGGTHSGSARFRARDVQALREGDDLPIRYLPEQPSINWPERHEPSGVPILIGPLLFAGTAAGALAIAATLRRQRRLLSEGRPAIARVMDAKRVQVGKHRPWRVSFEYTALSGARHRGSFDRGSKPPAVGTEITILYDPDNPKRVAQYPLSLVKTP